MKGKKMGNNKSKYPKKSIKLLIFRIYKQDEIEY